MGTVQKTRATSAAQALLFAQYDLSLIFVHCGNWYQKSFDEHHASFENIVRSMETVLEDDAALKNRNIGLFCLDLGMISTLFFVSIKCRHPVLRRRAVELILRGPCRELLWNAKDTVRLAKIVIEHEEKYMLPGDTTGCSIPEHRRIRDVDVLEDGSVMLVMHDVQVIGSVGSLSPKV